LQVAQAYDIIHTSDEDDDAPNPGHAAHTAADKEWSAAAKKKRSAALCRIDALESCCWPGGRPGADTPEKTADIRMKGSNHA